MVSVSILGIGNWGYNHLRTFAAIPDARVAAVCDLDEKVLARARREYPSVEATKDAAAAIARADAVVVSSSAKTHHELAKKALLADKHVLVEKPLALDPAQGRELVDLAASRRRVLMVGHLLLYHPAVVRLRELLDAGEIGKPLYMYSQRVNLGVIRRDENVVWSLAPHDLTMALLVFGGAPVRVRAKGQPYLQPGVADVAFLDLEFPNGRLAHIHVSWLDPHKVRKVTVVGDRRMVVFDDMATEEKLKIYDKGADPVGDGPLLGISVRYGDIRSPRVEAKEPLRLEAEHFVECARSGAAPRTDGRQGLEVLRILAALDRSLAAGGTPVEVVSA